MTEVSATVTPTAELGAAAQRGPSGRRIRASSKVFIGLSILVAAIAVSGFWPRYFGPLLRGVADKPRVIHLHAAVFTGWVALFAAQIILVALGRTDLHRKIGKAGIFYGFALIAVGLFTGVVQVAARIEAGNVASGLRFLLVILSDMAVFSVFFGAAVAYRRKPELHKRYMLVATTGLLVAATARMNFIPGPYGDQIQTLIWISPIFLALAYDFAARRVIHPVYVAGAITLIVLSERGLVARTEAWQSIAGWLTAWMTSSGLGSTLGRFPL